eukprot:scaffold319769_cov26-Tisochrysis_lutea.AAC.2
MKELSHACSSAGELGRRASSASSAQLRACSAVAWAHVTTTAQSSSRRAALTCRGAERGSTARCSVARCGAARSPPGPRGAAAARAAGGEQRQAGARR